MKYSKRTVDEAVQLLDVYASQRFWSPRETVFMSDLSNNIEARRCVRRLSLKAWNEALKMLEPATVCAAEAAQRLREGWRP